MSSQSEKLGLTVTGEKFRSLIHRATIFMWIVETAPNTKPSGIKQIHLNKTAILIHFCLVKVTSNHFPFRSVGLGPMKMLFFSLNIRILRLPTIYPQI